MPRDGSPWQRLLGNRWGRPSPFIALPALFLLVALLASACDAAGGAPRLGATPTVAAAPTPTLAPARPLDWQERQWPIAMGPSDVRLAVAQGDGDTAYLCSPGGAAPGHAQVWATRDRAAHWTHVSDIVVGDSIQSCYLVVDDLQPATVVADLCATVKDTYCNGPATYLSRDGGATWAPVSGDLTFFGQLATRDGVAYAITGTPGHSACSDCRATFAASRDGMRTWSGVDRGIGPVARFWLRPDTGALLAAVSSGQSNGISLWASLDGGQHWAWTGGSAVTGYVVQAPVAGLPWRACGKHGAEDYGYGTGAHVPPPRSVLACSADGGRTWTDAGGPYVRSASVYLIGIANDGSVLAEVLVEWQGPGTTAQYELRRLPPGASAWESLGRLPSLGAGYGTYFAGGSGALWVDSYEDGNYDSPRTLHTASYP